MDPTVRILSDDLTGALDTAVYLASAVDGVWTVGWGAVPAEGALAHSTETRDAKAPMARVRAANAAPWLFEARHAMKKVDSRLRGHVAAELDAVMQVGSAVRLVIAPAFPDQGRVVRGGRVFVCDPSGGVGPPEPVDLAADLAAMGIPVTRLTVPALRAGGPLPEGALLCDAETQADLTTVAVRGLASPGRTLWCGSAGLAGALATALEIPSLPTVRPRSPLLMIVGTNHPQTAAQICALEAADTVSILTPASNGVLPPSSSHQVDQLLKAAPARLVAPDEAERHVAGVMAGLSALAPPATAFVTGGATLLALAQATGATAILINGLYGPGTPAASFVDGAWRGVRLLTRSGSFGPMDYLTTLVASAERF